MTGSESQPRSKLNLTLAIEIGGVDIQRFAELGLARGEAGQEIQRRQAAVYAARFDGVARRLEFRYILVIEEIEALGEQFQLTHVTQVEALAETHVDLPCGRIAVCIAADSIDAVVATVAVHTGAESDNRRSSCVKFLG